MKFIRRCAKGGGCNNMATHVLVYLDKRSFKEITTNPKPYCLHHATYLQMTLKQAHDVLSRIYTNDEWMHRLENYKNHGGKIKITKV